MNDSTPRPTSSQSRRPYPSRLQLVLVLLFVAAVPGSWLGLRLARAWKQGRAILAICRIEGCQVAYDGEDVFDIKFHGTLPILPPVTWTEALLGKDFVHRAGTVCLPAHRVDEVMPHLERLPYLRRVVVRQGMNDTSDEQALAAVDRIEKTAPKLETVIVELDFDIEDNVVRNGD